jgi:hypothetical protein
MSFFDSVKHVILELYSEFVEDMKESKMCAALIVKGDDTLSTLPFTKFLNMS